MSTLTRRPSLVELDGAWPIEGAVQQGRERGMGDGGVDALTTTIDGSAGGDWRVRWGRQMALATRAQGAGLWEWDLLSGQFQGDRQVRELFGFPSAQALDISSLFRVVAADDRKRLALDLDEAAQGLRPLDTDFTVETPGGAKRFVRTVADLAYDLAGRPCRLTGIS